MTTVIVAADQTAIIDGRSSRWVIAAPDVVGVLPGDVGPPGPEGPPGAPAANPNYTFAINALASDATATLVATGAYPNLTLTFGIPRGVQGEPGPEGPPGDPAVNPNYTFSITALGPSDAATLTATGTYPNVTLAFGIPRGEQGIPGTGSGIVMSVAEGAGIAVNATDAANPVVALSSAAQTSLALADSAVQPTIFTAGQQLLISTSAGNPSRTDTVPANAVVGRAASGGIKGLTATEARTALALGGAAVLNVGTTAGTVAAGDHTQAISTITGLQAALDGKAANTVSISAGTGLTGGGNLAADRSIALSSGSIASLALADSAVQPAATQTLSGKTLSAPVVEGYTEGMATASGTAFSPNLAADTVFFYTTTGNAIVTMPAAASGKSFVIVVEYGGAHTLTWAGTSIRWPDGTPPPPTSVSGKRDTFPFLCVDGTTWQPGGMNI